MSRVICGKFYQFRKSIFCKYTRWRSKFEVGSYPKLELKLQPVACLRIEPEALMPRADCPGKLFSPAQDNP